MNAPPSPARLYCALVGAALVIVGVIGFFYSASFETGAQGVANDTDEVFGLLDVNGWHNLVHLALGLLALAVAGNVAAARTYALAAGLLYVLLAIWGFIDGDGIVLGLIPLDNADNLLHLILGLTGLAAGAATATDGSSRSGRPRAPRAGSGAAPKPEAKATPG